MNTRKLISRYKKSLRVAKTYDERFRLIKLISNARNIIKGELVPVPGAPNTVVVEKPDNLPTFGKFKAIVESNYDDELNEIQNSANCSDNDLKRLALKKAFMDFFNDLDYGPETVIVDFGGDMTLRRDNKDVDATDFDFAPGKNKIYNMWMKDLARYVREEKLSPSELDEASERGIPKGGAFEKQLDRYRQEIMKELWDDFYSQEENKDGRVSKD